MRKEKETSDEERGRLKFRGRSTSTDDACKREEERRPLAPTSFGDEEK